MKRHRQPLEMHAVLIVPGIGNSEPDHWQSIWERRYPGVTRVMQRDWDQPVCSEWAAAVEDAVATSAQPPVIVAHSLGCLAVAHWAFSSARKVAGLVLVAVPDPEGPNFPAAAQGFAPVPPAVRGRRALIISSSDDHYGNARWSRQLAEAYRAELIELTNAGHINVASGFGEWQEGWKYVSAFVGHR
jgi:predicted alpha/beta hydrolase family esterase